MIIAAADDLMGFSDGRERSSMENVLVWWNMARWCQKSGCLETIDGQHCGSSPTPAGGLHTSPLTFKLDIVSIHSKLLGECQWPASNFLAEPAKTPLVFLCKLVCVTRYVTITWKYLLEVVRTSWSLTDTRTSCSSFHSLHWEIIVSLSGVYVCVFTLTQTTTIPIHYVNLIENLWHNWLQIGVEIIQTCNNKSQCA